jgi:sulfate adenylyltransferase (ADP) / ATP adenylyltransferase
MNPTLIDLIKHKFNQECISKNIILQESDITRYKEGKLEYFVRRLRKANTAYSNSSKSGINPFQSPDDNVFVSKISEDYILILNKYPVLENHCLLIRNKFIRQEDPLEQLDFDSIWMFLRNLNNEDPFIFYNSGPSSGASQPHRHFQFIMLPQDNFPYLHLINESAKLNQKFNPSLPFLHRIFKLDNIRDTGKDIYVQYKDILFQFQSLLFLNEANLKVIDYNLVITLNWMMIIPRKHADFGSMSINSLGFLGIFLLEPDSPNLFNVDSLKEIYAWVSYSPSDTYIDSINYP